MDPLISEFFTESYRSNWYFAARAEVLTAIVNGCQKVDRHLRIVDLGAGTGEILARFRNGTVVAIETDWRLAQFGHATSRLPYVVADVGRGVPLKDSSADLVLLLDVLEHLAHDRLALQEVARIIRPGGKLVVAVPAFQSLWSRHDELHHHRRRYSKRALIEVLEGAGFTCERVTFYNTLLLPLVFMSRKFERVCKSWASGVNDYRKPPRAFAPLLRRIFSFERHILDWCNLPVGVSVLAVATIRLRQSGAE